MLSGEVSAGRHDLQVRKSLEKGGTFKLFAFDGKGDAGIMHAQHVAAMAKHGLCLQPANRVVSWPQNKLRGAEQDDRSWFNKPSSVVNRV